MSTLLVILSFICLWPHPGRDASSRPWCIHVVVSLDKMIFDANLKHNKTIYVLVASSHLAVFTRERKSQAKHFLYVYVGNMSKSPNFLLPLATLITTMIHKQRQKYFYIWYMLIVWCSCNIEVERLCQSSYRYIYSIFVGVLHLTKSQPSWTATKSYTILTTHIHTIHT